MLTEIVGNPKQPNFEKVKTAFYREFSPNQNAYTMGKAQMAIFQSTIATARNYDRDDFGSVSDLNDLGDWHKQVKKFNDDMNQWLDRVDIREAGSLIDAIIKNGGGRKLPSWMVKKQYTIDYNKHQFLDLIIIKSNSPSL